MNQSELINISAAHLKLHLKKIGCSKLFLVTGKRAYITSGASKYMDEALSGINSYHFSEFSINPNLDDVKLGVQAFKNFQPDVVIAIGGGSVIDMAKLVRYFSSYQDIEFESVLAGSKSEKITNTSTLIAIPTTSGTGSEATHFAVVYNHKKKYSIADQGILPNTSILNYKFTRLATQYLMAYTGLDALSQAIESFWSIYSSDLSKEYSRESIETILEFLPKAMNGNDDALRKMMTASNLAGKAINITKTTAPHAMSYVFTSHFGIPHGHAVALTLSSFFEYNFAVSAIDVTDPRGHEYVRQNLIELSKMFDEKTVPMAVQKLNTFISDIGVKVKLSELDVSEKDIDFLTENINYERLKNNPRSLTKEVAADILKKLL